MVPNCRSKIEEIRAAFDVRYKEYIKLDKNYNAWYRAEKKKEYEARQAARAERQQEEAAAAAADGTAAPVGLLYEPEVGAAANALLSADGLKPP